MRRREVITLLCGAAAWPLAAGAQQPSKIARVGFFRQSEPVEKHFNAFRSGLRALGYVEGQNSPSNSVTQPALTTGSASLSRIWCASTQM